MATPFKKILCPIDVGANGIAALDCAAQLAAGQDDVEVVILHVIPTVLSPDNAPLYTDLYKPQAEEIHRQLSDVARKHLRDVKHQVRVEIGHPPTVIVDTAARLPADLMVMATHRRRFARFLLGSVAETVMREVECPVMTVKDRAVDRMSVGQWMSARPVMVAPNEPLSVAQDLMHEGNFRTLPVVANGQMVGIVTDRDLRAALGKSDQITVEQLMRKDVVTVSPKLSIFDASRLLAERKIGAVPVMDNGRLVGIISSDDLLKAFAEVH
jgi:CBS domain-containing protein/nucleotide-binding universal stress UspA family protein